MPAKAEHSDDGQIPVTRWSLIDRAASLPGEGRRAALGEFILRYLPAMRSHLVRRRGWREDEVEDLLQSFVAERVLQGDMLSRADRGRRFRNYFLTVLDNYASNIRRARQAKKRIAEQGRSLDAIDEFGGEPATAPDADVFDLEWARQVLGEAIGRMRRQCEASGRMDLWEVFEARIRRPLLEGAAPMPYEAMVDRFGLKSPVQAANLLVSAKRAFERSMREVVGEYSQGPEQIDEEIRDLIEVLGKA